MNKREGGKNEQRKKQWEEKKQKINKISGNLEETQNTRLSVDRLRRSKFQNFHESSQSSTTGGANGFQGEKEIWKRVS